MRLLLVNPNSTASMTVAIEASAVGASAVGTVIEAVNPSEGPPSIESDDDERLCVPHLLKIVESAARRPAPPRRLRDRLLRRPGSR